MLTPKETKIVNDLGRTAQIRQGSFSFVGIDYPLRVRMYWFVGISCSYVFVIDKW